MFQGLNAESWNLVKIQKWTAIPLDSSKQGDVHHLQGRALNARVQQDRTTDTSCTSYPANCIKYKYCKRSSRNTHMYKRKQCLQSSTLKAAMVSSGDLSHTSLPFHSHSHGQKSKLGNKNCSRSYSYSSLCEHYYLLPTIPPPTTLLPYNKETRSR